MSPSNVHIYQTAADKVEVLLLSDIHFDNTKCQRPLLKRHLDEALTRQARIWINGDTLDLMAGRDDPRSAKSALRVELKTDAYVDAVINSCADFLAPYAHLIDFIGRGNHEQSILKRLETDPTARLVERLNMKTGSKIAVGGYGGWMVVRFTGANRCSWTCKYYHGTGGGGPSTRGMNHFHAMAAQVADADCIWQGHVHESTEAIAMVSYLRHDFTPAIKPLLYVRSSTYKEEFQDGHSGWSVEKMMPPKVLGGRWLTVTRQRTKELGLHCLASTQHAL